MTQTNFQLHFPGSNCSDRTDLFAIAATDTGHRIDHRMPAIHPDAGARTGILAGSAADTAFLYFIRFALYLFSAKCEILLLNPLCLQREPFALTTEDLKYRQHASGFFRRVNIIHVRILFKKFRQ